MSLAGPRKHDYGEVSPICAALATGNTQLRCGGFGAETSVDQYTSRVREAGIGSGEIKGFA